MLQSFYHWLETAQGYSLAQFFGWPTIQRYRMFVHKHVPQETSQRVLEIGCGIGSSRQLFAGDYTGIDINPDYIAKAQRQFNGKFHVMNAAALPFARDSFDHAVCIATTHHLSDDQLAAMVKKAVVVARKLHIIDAILPLSSKALLKRALFQMDRGQFVRTFDQLRDLIKRSARIECDEATTGPLHDVCYIRASRID